MRKPFAAMYSYLSIDKFPRLFKSINRTFHETTGDLKNRVKIIEITTSGRDCNPETNSLCSHFLGFTMNYLVCNHPRYLKTRLEYAKSLLCEVYGWLRSSKRSSDDKNLLSILSCFMLETHIPSPREIHHNYMLDFVLSSILDETVRFHSSLWRQVQMWNVFGEKRAFMQQKFEETNFKIGP